MQLQPLLLVSQDACIHVHILEASVPSTSTTPEVSLVPIVLHPFFFFTSIYYFLYNCHLQFPSLIIPGLNLSSPGCQLIGKDVFALHTVGPVCDGHCALWGFTTVVVDSCYLHPFPVPFCAFICTCCCACLLCSPTEVSHPCEYSSIIQLFVDRLLSIISN